MFLLTNEQRHAMGIAARNRIIKDFDKKIVIDAYLKAIEEINVNQSDIKKQLLNLYLLSLLLHQLNLYMVY